MKFKSPVYTQVSGSVGGLTYASNAGGMYCRGRGIPTQPNTPAQQNVKNVFGILSTAWRDTLSQAQREAWTLYAENSPVTSRLGDPLILSGQQMFLRCNTPRVVAGVARVDDGPVAFGLSDLGDVTYTAPNDGESVMTFDVTAGGPWIGTDDSFLIVQQGRPQSVTRNFFKGPWQVCGTIEGNTAVPITGTQTVPEAFPFSIGQKVFTRICVSLADGRLSSAPIAGQIVNP